MSAFAAAGTSVGTVPTVVSELSCPICGSGIFADYRKRKLARCAGCGSLERTRAMALVIKKLLPNASGQPVYHFAPERSIAALLQERYGDAYTPADFDPSQFRNFIKPLVRVDLSTPLAFIREESVQGLIHSHVLEHVPGDIARVISEMNATIAPGGFHTFVVPFFSQWYREDMDPNLSHDERDRLYGQFDHLRSFGIMDFEERFLVHFKDFERVDVNSFVSPDELAKANVLPSSFTRLTVHTVFHFVKKGSAPLKG